MRRDARNTLTAVFENGVEVGRYDYDYNLMRIRRTTANENIEYVLDDKHILNELDASGNSIRRYHYGTKVLAVTESAGTSYILNDGIGSASDFWTSTGTLAKSRQYDAWGNFRNGTAPAAGEAKVAYTGHQYDPETGWVYAKARYYDPELGIFLSRDAHEGNIGNAPSLHRFTYAAGNPLKYWDADGHALNLITAAVGAGIGLVAGVGISVAVQAMTGDGEINWKKAAAAGVGGMVSGGIAGLTMGGSLLAQAGATVGGGVVGGQVTRTMLGEKTTAGDVATDALVSGVTFGLMKGASAFYRSFSSSGKMDTAIKELEKEFTVAEKAAEKAGQKYVRIAGSSEGVKVEVEPGGSAGGGGSGSRRLPLENVRESPSMAGQESENGCGWACLRELARREGKDFTEAEIRAAGGGLGDNPARADQLALAAKEIGLTGDNVGGALPNASVADRFQTS